MPQKIALFFSRARYEHLEDSDHDIILVSYRFESYNFLDMLAMFHELRGDVFAHDVSACTPEEDRIWQRQLLANKPDPEPLSL